MISFDFSELYQMGEDIVHDMSLLEGMIQDGEFLRALEEIVIENFDRVFDTEGSNIGSDWSGNDLVDTGTLKLSLTSVGEIGIQISGDNIIFSSNVPYATNVNNKFTFYGVDDEFAHAMSELVADYLKENGKLDWEK